MGSTHAGLLSPQDIVKVESDGFDPHYNPNGDDIWGNVADYVHAKQAWVAEATE